MRAAVYVVDAEPGEGSWRTPLPAAAAAAGAALPDPESLACLLYTSGTSGRPRAAMLTHRALLANIEQAAQVDAADDPGDDVVLGVLPLFHVYGLNAVLGRCCASGRSWCSSTASTRRDARPDRRRGRERASRSRRPSSPTG